MKHMRRSLPLAFVLLLAFTGCARAEQAAQNAWESLVSFVERLLHLERPKPPMPHLHYVVGEPYEAGGHWYYPHAQFQYDTTGIAVIAARNHPPLTADGEVYDPNAMAIAHQTLQLPAIGKLTNLENGRSVMVRINDRGPAQVSRFVEVTPRVAALLGFDTTGLARVRLQLDQELSEALAMELQGNASAPAIATAPREQVAETTLAPPPGVATSTPASANAAAKANSAAPSPQRNLPKVPLRLPETVTQGAATGGSLWILVDTFHSASAATTQRNALANFGAHVVRSLQDGQETDQVMIGPIGSIPEADALLERVIKAGAVDARIVVEQE